MSIDIDKVESAIVKQLDLSPFNAKIAIGFLQKSIEKNQVNQQDQHLDSHTNSMVRVLNYLLDILNHKLWIAKPRHNLTDGSINWQYGCPECLRGLRSCPIWPRQDTPWVHILEDAFHDIRAEFLRICGGGITPSNINSSSNNSNNSNIISSSVDNGGCDGESVEQNDAVLNSKAVGGGIFQPYRSPKPSSSASSYSSYNSSSPSPQQVVNSCSHNDYSKGSVAVASSSSFTTAFTTPQTIHDSPLTATTVTSIITATTATTTATRSDELGVLATDRGDWDVCYLYLHGIDFQENLNLFPLTAKAISLLPRPYDHAFLSALSPGTHITPHFGPTNKKLRCMLPLYIPQQRLQQQKQPQQQPSHKEIPIRNDNGIDENKDKELNNSSSSSGSSNSSSISSSSSSSSSSSNNSIRSSSSSSSGNSSSSSGECWLRVADQRVKLVEGKCIVFDDSFEHEAGYDIISSNTVDDNKLLQSPSLLQRRVVLVADIWHPDFSDDEVRFMNYIMKAQMRAVKNLKQKQNQKQQQKPSPNNADVSSSKNNAIINNQGDDDFISVILHNRELQRQKQQQRQQQEGTIDTSLLNIIVRDD